MEVILLFGSNIEPRDIFIHKAMDEVSEKVGEVIKQSELYESEPWGFNTNNNFLNQVAIVDTELTAQKLLSVVLSIEKKLGRKREEGGYSSRTIDIDILYFGSEIVNEKRLTIPHPRIQERRFVLTPLNEILEQMSHPVLKKTHAELLQICEDSSKVWKYEV